ncbi:hypothetical protein LCGC14_1852040 [marine sediment metagenome]|uniref:Uncharacterized protein n=1 Tax=marine sediment metagenome TaxID=412755 RepID=A0A0F9GAC0_9ZZZZ
MALTDAGLTIAGTVGGQVNLPPVIISTPNPVFIEGIADTYDMSQNFTDDGQSTVITSLTNILPNGESYNGNTHILTYDGIGIPSVSQHQLQVDDQVNPVVTSAIFNIEIREITSIESPYGYGVSGDSSVVIGGRGFSPVFVKNQNRVGADSLSEKMGLATGAHIMFESAGIIDSFAGGRVFKIRNAGNKTIWGNAAPQTPHLHGGGSAIQFDVDNIIVGDIEVIMGDEPGGEALDNRDCLIITTNLSSNRAPSNILCRNMTLAGSTDELWQVASNDGNSNSNYTFYRILSGYPIADSGRGERHNFGPLLNQHNRVALIETAIAHTAGRPNMKANQYGCMLSCLFYMWNASIITLDGRFNAEARMWIECCRWIPDDGGTQAPQYGGVFPGTGATVCITGGNLTAADMVYAQNNDYGGVTRANGLGTADETDRDIALSKMELPEDYVSSFQVDFWTDANLSSSLTLLGANPTVPSALALDIRNSIINRDGVWVDSINEIPSGGYPVIPTKTHQQEMGKTLEQWFIDEVGEANYHLVAPGFNFKTNFEVAAESFVAGIPT